MLLLYSLKWNVRYITAPQHESNYDLQILRIESQSIMARGKSSVDIMRGESKCYTLYKTIPKVYRLPIISWK